MDEAERCDRIAFMSAGVLLALDTPDNLKKDTIAGHMVALDLAHPMEHLARIEALPFVSDCSIHGASIHVVLDQISDQTTLQAITGIQPRPIMPNLEDVFITLAKKRAKGGTEV
jgi:ABC-2 type transport system ATP-binding protein